MVPDGLKLVLWRSRAENVSKFGFAPVINVSREIFMMQCI
jgi:hypothetical protein